MTYDNGDWLNVTANAPIWPIRYDVTKVTAEVACRHQHPPGVTWISCPKTKQTAGRLASPLSSSSIRHRAEWCRTETNCNRECLSYIYLFFSHVPNIHAIYSYNRTVFLYRSHLPVFFTRARTFIPNHGHRNYNTIYNRFTNDST